MEENQGARSSVCKICGKSFPSGRSLGGHMRSHLSSFSGSDHLKTGDKMPKNGAKEESAGRILSNSGKTCGEDAFLHHKSCKQCGKSCSSFNGHKKRHKEEDYWLSSLESTEKFMDTHSDNEDTTLLCRRKRSNRVKMYENATNSSSDLTVAVSNDQLEKEEVALSLLLLSAIKPQMESVQVIAKGFSLSENETTSDPEVTKFKKPQEKGYFVDHDNLSNSSPCDTEKKGKFLCVFCLKDFPSCQALGGHRASQMRFKGCCVMRNKTCKKKKEHQCSICLRLFPTGQALGGHKRSHSISDKSKISGDPQPLIGVTDIRHLPDLNMPDPDDEESTEVKALTTYKGYKRR